VGSLPLSERVDLSAVNCTSTLLCMNRSSRLRRRSSPNAHERTKQQVTPDSALNLFSAWSNDSSSLFVCFKLGDCRGFAHCSIKEVSLSQLRLSWDGGELTAPLEGASFEETTAEKSDCDLRFLNANENCVLIHLASGDWLLFPEYVPRVKDIIREFETKKCSAPLK
jgi:hypothetical protein